MSFSTPLNPTATPFLPAVTSLPTLSDDALTSTLDLLFELSPDLHTLALPTMRSISFDSYDELISTIRDILLALTETLSFTSDPSYPSTAIDDDAPKAPLLRILSAHPRLGEKKVDSALSRAEQANLRGGGGDSEEVLEQLRQLNEEYEKKFPGLRYVVFVNGRGRGEVMDDMRWRIDRGDYEEEEREGVRAMCDIARDRAGKLLGAAKGR
ncbi:Oxo-4-hydroxy-4-carboxy-5-ureidoimidazoline decarboxylase [Coniochaeta sp. 2T2.1]|nr:Oxo-4-hydroxy-4-carboxy-5-ureidoimidazoline decarboxylase [Coniochaeta sp. 2T2.1]